MDERLRVLFLCTHNSARSQMAEGLARHLGGDRVRSFSAGTEKSRIRSMAVRVMDEIGIDIGAQTSKTLHGYLNDPFDIVITVCDAVQERCPVFRGARRTLHWSIPDPGQAAGSEEERLAFWRRVRDDLRTRISELLAP